MTPQQRMDKWREEAIEWLHRTGHPLAGCWSDSEIQKVLESQRLNLNHLIIEYIVNVKHADNDTTKGA